VGHVFNPRTRTFNARIGNINTAESVHPDESRNTAAGEKASAYAKRLIEGRDVKFACWDTGYYLRPICSVWASDQSSDFATAMIEAGYSTYVTKYGNHPFWHDHYQSLESGSNRN